MNTHKHTALIRLASCVLLAADAWLLCRFPSLETAMMLWFPAAMALTLVVTPKESRFR
jgi:hypothetical protein